MLRAMRASVRSATPHIHSLHQISDEYTLCARDRGRHHVARIGITQEVLPLCSEQAAMCNGFLPASVRGEDQPVNHSLYLTIDILAVTNLENEDDEFLVLNRVNDAEIAFADAVEIILTGKFLHPWRAGILLQPPHAFDEAFLDGRGERTELAFSQWGEKNRIGHGQLETKIFENRVKRLRSFLLRLGQRGARIGQIDSIFQFL